MSLLPEWPLLALFMASSLALLLLPGPAVFYIIARSVSQGRQAGLVSTLGVGLGSLLHVVAAAAGLSALLVSSADLFSLVRLAGAAYLVYLGIQSLRARPRAIGRGPVPAGTLGRIFREGVVVNLLNPKTAMFFVAFLPQFADPARGAVGPQIFALGALFVALGVITDGIYALAAGTLSGRLQRSAAAAAWKDRVAGVIYLLLGLLTLTVERPRT